MKVFLSITILTSFYITQIHAGQEIKAIQDNWCWTNSNNKLTMSTCESKPARQRFTFDRFTREIKSDENDFCLDRRGNAAFRQCDGSNNQKWVYNPNDNAKVFFCILGGQCIDRLYRKIEQQTHQHLSKVASLSSVHCRHQNG